MSRGAPRTLAFLLALLALTGTACPGDDGDDGGVAPFFPEDYDETYVELRNCRGSGDHELNNIRILVDAAAREAYEGRQVPFPTGAVVMKEEYDFGDTSCAGERKQWTVMRKLEPGSAPEALGWAWQQVDAARRVVDEDPPRCINCHQGCGIAPDGYDGTCSIP